MLFIVNKLWLLSDRQLTTVRSLLKCVSLFIEVSCLLNQEGQQNGSPIILYILAHLPFSLWKIIAAYFYITYLLISWLPC